MTGPPSRLPLDRHHVSLSPRRRAIRLSTEGHPIQTLVQKVALGFPPSVLPLVVSDGELAIVRERCRASGNLVAIRAESRCQVVQENSVRS